MCKEDHAEQRIAWGFPVRVLVCTACDLSFLASNEDDQTIKRCPHCSQGDLESVRLELSQLPCSHSPELVIIPSVTPEVMRGRIDEFAGKIPYPPDDLRLDTLHQRLQLVWFPVWLVDCAISAVWNAESGYDYGVVSHQEHFSDIGWTTQQVEETRIRWEPRIGRMQRLYQNVTAPALEEHTALWQRLGGYPLNQATVYSPEWVRQGLIRMPDRSPETAWSEVTPLLYKIAGNEVMKATSAEHIRNFRWSPEYKDKKWTLLLAPAYATYYTDDNGAPQPVLIHALTGQVDGSRRSSMKSAQRQSFVLAGIALAFFMLSLILGAVGFMAPPLMILGILGIVISACVGIGALIPMLRSWRFNLNNDKQGNRG